MQKDENIIKEISDRERSTDFIRAIIKGDRLAGMRRGKVITRFPPEPNGYLHIGHAKSICLNFGIAKEFDGRCHLRFDDTNPEKEETEYVESIKENITWLGFDWGEHLYYASDYYEQLYQYAIHLVKEGKAYVCDLSPEEVRQHRGTLIEPGKESPYRARSVAENLDLFERMRSGEFEDGSRVLRAKIDMTSPNINMRDPVMYRILRAEHHRTGNAWCIYPMYDFAHPISDALEDITHSICTLEFEDHRPLYDWFLDNLPVPCHPQQIEFARLNLSYTVMSKRKLLELVEGKYVSGWDDPRMPTISGLRRRGYTPDAIRKFCERIGVAKRDSIVDMALLEHTIREDLNDKAKRIMCVLRPVKIIIDNYPEGKIEEFDIPYHPDNPSMGSRKVLFSKEIYIERDDFMEDPPKKFFRLAPGREVRLRGAYFITCISVKKNEAGEIVEIHCTYDPCTRGGDASDGRKVKGTLHWVSASRSIAIEVRMYDRLFTIENPNAGDFKEYLNPKSLEILTSSAESSLQHAEPETCFQFERQGYFCVDRIDSRPQAPVLNRVVGLRDSWAKERS